MSITEAATWSTLAGLIKNYFKLIDAGDGIMRIFGYASLIDMHTTIKPAVSRTLPNERARLKNMEVAMNLLTDKLYAGLEESSGECAWGINITISPDDRKKALTGYIKRELGELPWGTGINDIYEGNTAAFGSVNNTSSNRLKKYIVRIENVEIATFEGIIEVPALAVITNKTLETSLVGKPDRYIADLLMQDSQSLEYFRKDALFPARACGMSQKRLEAIDTMLNILPRAVNA